MTERIVLCWQGHRDLCEFGTPEYIQSLMDYPDGATCMLLDGHAGPHEWTSDAEIVLFLDDGEEDS